MSKSAPIEQLSDRSQHLLKVLVEHYLSDGQPVGSRTLSRDSGLQLSPATIRNVMSDLEDLGYIKSPHTSAGRIPTVQGYRFFVDTLLATKPLSEIEIDNLKEELSSDMSHQQLIEKTSSLLSGVTNLASVVTVPRTEVLNLEHIEFIALNHRRVLVVLVVDKEEVQNRIINVDRDYTQSELTEFSNFLNARLMGRDLKSIRADIIEEMKTARETANAMMIAAITMAEEVLHSGSGLDDFVVMGETKLMDFAELSTLDKLKHLFDAFHKKQEILGLLDRCVDAEGIHIFIGDESGYEVLDDWSVVTAPYSVDGEMVGVLGVIGPTRMAYDRVIPIVDMTARLLGSALKPS